MVGDLSALMSLIIVEHNYLGFFQKSGKADMRVVVGGGVVDVCRNADRHYTRIL
jgi:hypothetical protein